MLNFALLHAIDRLMAGTGANKVTPMAARFAKRLRASRIAAGFDSARAFAEAIDVNEFSYRNYELGTRFPALDILDTICNVLGKSADWLLFGKGPASRSDDDK